MQRNSAREPWLWLGLAIIALPFLAAQLFGYTFAPVDVLSTYTLPYKTGGFPQSHFWSDTVNFYWPRLVTFANGEFPISYTSGGGLPLYADTISGYFSPFAWLSFGLLGKGYFALDLFWFLQYAAFFSGWYFLARAFSFSPFAAFATGIVQAFCTHYFVGSYFSFQSLGAMTFLPWALWAYARYRDENWLIGRWFWAPFFLALCVYAGNVQTAMFPAIVFSFWLILQKDWKNLLLIGCLAVLLSLPLWLTGVEYHWLQNIGALDRRSQVPPDFLSKLKIILALPGILFPEYLGSPRHIDGLKFFSTSATYFYGSVGFILPLLIASAWNNIPNHFWKKISVVILFFTVFCLFTPILNFLYYRVFCLLFFAIGLLAAFVFSEEKIDRSRLQKFAIGMLALSLIWVAAVAWVKKFHAENLLAYLNAGIQKSVAEAWLPGYGAERVQRFLRSYASDWRTLWLICSLAILAIGAKKIPQRILIGLILVDLFFNWRSSILWQKQLPIFNQQDYLDLKQELMRLPNFPFSRLTVMPCESGAIYFAYPQNEFYGLPKLGLYGSTRISALTEQEIACDYKNKVVKNIDSTNKIDAQDYFQKAGVALIVVAPDWQIDRKDFSLWKKTPQYDLWQNNKLNSIVPENSQNKLLDWSHWGFTAEIIADKALGEWTISMPYYPGWEYFLNDKRIIPAKFYAGAGRLPVFNEALAAKGKYELRAGFSPKMIYFGLLGFFFALFWMVLGWLGEKRS